MSKKTLIIFDFDGTVVDSLKILGIVAEKLFEECKLGQFEDTMVDKMRELSARELITHFGVPLHKLPKIESVTRRLTGEHIDELQPIDGMIELIKELAANNNVQLVLVTSNSRKNIDYLLKKFSIDSTFDSVYTGVGIFGKYIKIRRIAKKSRALQVASVGDEVRDIDAARVAGVDSIAVDWGLNARVRLTKSRPTHVVSSAKQLRGVLQKYTD